MKLVSQSSRMQEIFFRVAPHYGFLNHLLSLGLDTRWRRYAAGLIEVSPEANMLDIATGTGVLALEIARHTKSKVKVIGLDISEEMLTRARRKVEQAGFTRRISFQNAPAEELPFDDDYFEAVAIGFGIRNLSEPIIGLREIYRVLKPEGRAVILEFSLPPYRILRFIYRLYLTMVVPLVGRLIAQDEAYRYLSQSVLKMPGREEFEAVMNETGFQYARHHNLGLGIGVVHLGEKPLSAA